LVGKIKIQIVHKQCSQIIKKNHLKSLNSFSRAVNFTFIQILSAQPIYEKTTSKLLVYVYFIIICIVNSVLYVQ